MNLFNNFGKGPQNAGVNDSLIAVDLLLSAKAGIKTCAQVLTETATPQVRAVVKRQLNEAIQFHEQVYRYMESKGLYHAKDFNKQLQVDLQMIQQVNQLH